MPRPNLPPTPQSSLDLTPKLPPNLSSLELAFTLPPPALGSIASSQNSGSTASKQTNDVSPTPSSPSPPPPPPSSSSSSSYYTPVSPASPGEGEGKAPNSTPQQSKKRHRASILEEPNAQPSPKQNPTAAEAITLPPPPTRNRKIIQMKPPQPSISSPSSTQQPPAPETKPRTKKGAAGSKGDKLADDAKSTSASGRKIARKTAHSLIERRRRFKMNEEFGVLKGMIPACTGVEMHKLAILQASIEYLKYLEQCVTDLKASNSAATHKNQVPTLPPGGYDNDDEEDEDDENDEEMVDPEPTHDQRHEEQPSDESANEEIAKPAGTEAQSFHSTYHSAPELTSPYLDSIKSHSTYPTPQVMLITTSPNLYPLVMSTATSPNKFPQHPPSENRHDQVDTEATHALLLLADGSRRSSEVTRDAGLEKKGRGMSVKDLLSP